jgi:hypothetical protein
VIAFARLSFRTLLIAAVPAWILMRVGAEWVASKGWDDVKPVPAWLDIGYITAEAGGLLILISTILAGIGARRLGRSNGEQGATLVRIAAVLVVLVTIAYVITTWAMSAKPD